MEAPETHDQALALAVIAKAELVQLEVNLAEARARYDCQQAVLLERRDTMSPDELALAENQLCDDAFELECAKQVIWDFAPEIPVWDSGFQFNDRGEDFSVAVLYMPMTFTYEVLRTDEHGERVCGSFKTRIEAMSGARWETTGIDDRAAQPAPEPEFSREESNAAGEIVIHLAGETLAVKHIVDHALDRSNLGCGQHYGDFVLRAREVLSELQYQVTDIHARDALSRYLAYERF